MEDFLRALRHLSLSDQREGYTWLLSDRCGRLRLLFTPGQATALPLSPLILPGPVPPRLRPHLWQ